MTFRTIAIIGAGFSGSLLATQIVRRAVDRKVYLIERSGVFGRGLAYGTPFPEHLLNVRSGRMSAFPDEPDHFVDWLAEHRPEFADPQGFAPRMVYGDYVEHILTQAGEDIVRVAGEAVRIEPGAEGVLVHLADGRDLAADAAVLATGNPPPSDANARGLADNDRYIGDPWAQGALARIAADDDVMLLGAGLTMIDVVLALSAQGWRGRALALSRRGLLPRPHDATQATVPGWRPESQSVAGMLREVRARMEEVGWAQAMDEMRPFNQLAWRQASEKERGRFLRHLRPWWDVHRHRTAPAVGEKIAALVESGHLRVASGRIEVVEPLPDSLVVDWRARGARGAISERFGWMVNCTGPLADLSRSTDPLLSSLFAAGVARVDPASLGLDVEDDCRLQASDGSPHRRLFALGPPTKGQFWEIVAVPDIRAQAQELARELVAA